jgi:hypothetical protein
MSDETIDLTKGGRIVVIIGNGGFVKEYEHHPQVTFFDIINYKTYADLNNVMPVDTKLVIITDGIPQPMYLWITSTYCRQKKIVFLVRRSNNAIYETLKKYLTVDNTLKVSPEEAKDTFQRGKLEPLIPLIDFSKSNTEMGKILMNKAVELGIRTTEGSLIQLVSNQRKKQNGGTVPKSARSQLDVSVEMLDQAIHGLTDIRDFLIATVEENRMLRQKVERFKKVMED